jgi:hypothetical protein
LGEVLILRVFIGSAEKYIHNYEMLVLIRISETGALRRHETGLSGNMKQELSIYLKKSY